MTIKSIIDVEVNDAEFKNFSAMFEKYKAALGEMPNAWKAIGDEIGKAGTTYEMMLAAMVTQAALTKSIEKTEKEAAAAAEKKRKEEAAAAKSGAAHWKDMARTTKSVAGNILGATTSLLKWTGIFSGITAAGALIGIDRMAGSVAGGRRASQGLGLSYGENKAFGIDYGSVVDPSSFLASVSQALHSANDRVGLIGAGMGQGDMEGSTGQVAANLLTHLKKIADNTNPRVLSDVMKARSIDQFVSLEDMMRIKAMTPDEFKVFQGKYTEDKGTLNLDRETQFNWLRFTQQMSRSGAQIENTFARTLVTIEPQLESLSKSFAHLIEGIGNSPAIKKWMGDLSEGLEHFAAYVQTQEFKDTMTNLGHQFVELAEGLGKLLKFLGFIKDDSKPDQTGKVAGKFAGITAYHDDRSAWTRLIDGPLTPEQIAKANPPAPASAAGPIIPRTSFMDSLKPPAGSMAAQFADIEQRRGLPPGFMRGLAEAESSMNPNAVGPVTKSGERAHGMFQFMEGTAKENGVTDPFNPSDAAEGAGRYVEKLMKEFKGDLVKVIAAYNWGPGNVEKAGGNLMNAMPDETQRELIRVLSKIAQSTHKIEISNPAGANIWTQNASVAAGGSP